MFGFGRRICPGRFLADSSLFHSISTSLAAFNVGKAVAVHTGRVIEPVVGKTPGIVSHPTPFRCSIVPRSDKYAATIETVEVDHPWEEGHVAEMKGFGLV